MLILWFRLWLCRMESSMNFILRVSYFGFLITVREFRTECMNAIKWQSLAANAFYTLICTQTFQLRFHYEHTVWIQSTFIVSFQLSLFQFHSCRWHFATVRHFVSIFVTLSTFFVTVMIIIIIILCHSERALFTKSAKSTSNHWNRFRKLHGAFSLWSDNKWKSSEFHIKKKNENCLLTLFFMPSLIPFAIV